MDKKKKLYKNKAKAKLSGVCAGLAEYFDADVTLIRIILVIGAFATNFVPGLLAYIACALIMPDKTEILDDFNNEL